MDAATLAVAFGLPPKDAIAYLRGKGFAIGFDWEEVWQEAQAQAFTVAKVGRLDILQDIRGVMQQALDEGRTQRWFAKELEPILRKKGWWGRKDVVAPNGETRNVELGSPWRLANIYRTNMQTAQMAGRYARQVEIVADRPYWRYVAVLDAVTRPEHRALHGLVFHYTDPFWAAYYPPNGFGCRCRVQALTEAEARAFGVSVSTGRMGTTKKLVSQRTGELRDVATFRTRHPVTGRDIVISPDVGWSYNPGAARYQPSTGGYTVDLAALAKRELQP